MSPRLFKSCRPASRLKPGVHLRFEESDPDIPILARCGPAAAWAVPAVIGGLGLFQNAQAQSRQAGLMKQGIDAAAPQTAAEMAQLQLAQNYNPALEDRKAVSAANQNATSLINSDLSNLSGRFSAGGGSPTGDSAFNLGATNSANRTLDPLRQWQAQLVGSETQRKANMYNQVYNAPAGQFANNYFNAAQMTQPNWGPSLQMFENALMKIPGWGGKAVGPSPWQSGDSGTLSGTVV